jgi:retron-type reverse transcriptase
VKRIGNLWDALLSWENLYEAARRAALGKRKRPDVAAFLFNLEPEVIALRRELEEDSYVPGPYRTFTVLEPKRRLISAAPFRDRVVHHALTQILEPIFERRFTADSYACRVGFGAHRALKKVSGACRRYRYVLKCDIQKYFPSIDHGILIEQLARVVKCKPTLALAARIVAGSNEQESMNAYFPGDDLFTPFERPRGLPLGNQTSQFFANVYLNPLDHFVARELRPGLYARYVDDFLLFGDEKEQLAVWRGQLVEFLNALRLNLHAGKSRIYQVGDGVTFLGWRLFPAHARLVRGNVVRARRRLEKAAEAYNAGAISYERFRCRLGAWLGHALHGNTKRIRELILERVILKPVVHRQHRLAGRFLEQQSTERPRIEP